MATTLVIWDDQELDPGVQEQVSDAVYKLCLQSNSILRDTRVSGYSGSSIKDKLNSQVKEVVPELTSMTRGSTIQNMQFTDVVRENGSYDIVLAVKVNDVIVKDIKITV